LPEALGVLCLECVVFLEMRLLVGVGSGKNVSGLLSWLSSLPTESESDASWSSSNYRNIGKAGRNKKGFVRDQQLGIMRPK